MKFFFVLLLITFSSKLVSARQDFPPVYEIKTDTAAVIRLEDFYWQMLEDPEGKWPIDEVSRPSLANKFHANTTKTNGILELNYSINTFWFRYRLKNSMRHEAKITIPKNVTYADFYTPASDGKWSHKLTGTAVPWSNRDDLKRITAVTYTIQPAEELLIYERNNFDYQVNIPDFLEINFGFTDKVIKDNYDDTGSSILPSFIFGVFLLASLFNLYFFLIVSGRVYLFFSLTLLFHAISRFLASTDIFFREHPTVRWYLVQDCGVLYFFFLIHFVRYFFETFKYFQRWDKYLIGLSIYYILNFILLKNDIIPIEYQDVIGPGMIMISILITFILFLRSHVKGVRLAIVTTLPVICIMCIPSFVVLLKLLNEYTGIPIPAFLKWVWVSNRFSVLEQIGLVWGLIFFSWSLFERYRQLQMQITQETLAKERLAKEKETERAQLISQQKVQLEKEVEERRAQLKQSLNDLKSTQSQLIQSEKMASLGELTAGIAHEIQNPLNFVNNFSEVNKELLDEMENELNAGNKEEAISIAKDIKDNEQKINHHGKRADAIAKAMLQHSRTSSGQKEPTDINALADEYLRLSYHGLRAKDSSFNVTMKTEFDEKLSAEEGTGKVNIIPQDIGRVFLNLFTNAFYSVNEKKKKLENFEPTVSIRTKKLNDTIEIQVRDNGTGIRENIIGKIFQPFFTTKPSGQGTGLGLSLSYDIIKAHGGELKAGSKEGLGTVFTIIIPAV